MLAHTVLPFPVFQKFHPLLKLPSKPNANVHVWNQAIGYPKRNIPMLAIIVMHIPHPGLDFTLIGFHGVRIINSKRTPS
jgi:hypothetical protein